MTGRPVRQRFDGMPVPLHVASPSRLLTLLEVTAYLRRVDPERMPAGIERTVGFRTGTLSFFGRVVGSRLYRGMARTRGDDRREPRLLAPGILGSTESSS